MQQFTNPVLFTANLTMFIEGFYNSSNDIQVSDTVKVYIRSSVSPFAKVDSSKAVLNSSGSGIFSFSNVVNKTGYYIQISHRNSIETWSKNVQSFSGGNLNYNFSSATTQAFGNNMKQIDTLPLRFGIYSGDQNQDGIVDLNDVVNVNNASSVFTTGKYNE